MKLKLAVAGAGLIGKTHVRLIQDSAECELVAVADPATEGKAFAEAIPVAHYPSLPALLSDCPVDGVILATPNSLHVEQTLQCLQAEVPALIEKPVAHSLEAGEQLLAATQATAVPFLVGHHRMHSPIMAQARKVIAAGADGRLGKLVSIMGSAQFYKPAGYFAAGEWRTRKGGGPILINLIHEIGNLRYLCGEIIAVQAMQSSHQRGFEVEDTCAILLRFANGVLGTFLLSDTAATVQSWEQTAQENPAYAAYPDEDCYHIAGTRGSLSVPTMRLNYYPDDKEASWWQPFQQEQIDIQRHDPLALQLAHFCAMIRGETEPLVTISDGLQSLRVVEAIAEAAQTGELVTVGRR